MRFTQPSRQGERSRGSRQFVGPGGGASLQTLTIRQHGFYSGAAIRAVTGGWISVESVRTPARQACPCPKQRKTARRHSGTWAKCFHTSALAARLRGVAGMVRGTMRVYPKSGITLD